MTKKKVLLIGWDAADWKIMHPLIDSEKMPTLKKFISEGVMGNLATLDPPLSPIMWTSIGTGKTADKHGVMGFTQPREDGSGIQPVLSTSRKVKAIWNILMQEGYKSHVIGWWPSHPADPINGVCISNFYHHSTGSLEDEWKMAPGTVHPPELADILAELRVHPEELTANHIAPFVPDMEKIDQINAYVPSPKSLLKLVPCTLLLLGLWKIKNGIFWLFTTMRLTIIVMVL